LGWELKVDSELIINGQNYFASITKSKNGSRLKIGDEEIEFKSIDFSGNCLKLNINGIAKTVYVAKDKDKAYVHLDGIVIPVEEAREEGSSGRASGEEIVDGKQMIHAPMPGKIVKIAVEEGQTVKEKAILCIVEAMKMENEIRAKINGVVKDIKYKAGDLVGTEEIILVVESTE